MSTKHIFIFKTTRTKYGRENSVPVKLGVQNIEIKEKVTIDSDGVLNLGYGFGSEMNQCSAKDPGMKREYYRLHNSFQPNEGDTLTHVGSGRVFMFGKKQGFIHYTIELLENGKHVATAKYEDYYKD